MASEGRHTHSDMALCPVWLVVDRRSRLEVKVFQRLNSPEGIELGAKDRCHNAIVLVIVRCIQPARWNTYSRLAIEPFHESPDGHEAQNEQ